MRLLGVSIVAFLVLIGLTPCAVASISANEVVVVCNNHPDVATVSRAVADYYCTARGIPQSNIAEVTASPNQDINPTQFLSEVLAGNANPQSLVYLLKHRPGFDINDPGSDPTKCIVLC